MRLITPLIFIFVCAAVAFGQADTLVSYNVRTRTITVLPVAPVDSASSFDTTGSNRGTEPGFSKLSLTPPKTPYKESGSIYYTPAHQLFPVSNYPMRTAVKLFRYSGDSLSQECSGIMVGKDLVLAAAHCVHYYFNSRDSATFSDSTLVVPAYDNGVADSALGESVSSEYILAKTDLTFPISQDLVLIKLRQPIGIKTGWIGIAFDENDSDFANMVMQQFSYPGTVDPYDSTKVFNGDTMYYNYGIPSVVTPEYLGFLYLDGIPGQSGASLFYTDNVHYYSFAVQQFSLDAEHFRISKDMFYALKAVIDGGTSSIETPPMVASGYVLTNAYPNPFNPTTTISYSAPRAGHVSLKVYDVLGREVAVLVNRVVMPGLYTVRFDAAGLSSGVYFCRMTADGFNMTRKLMLLK